MPTDISKITEKSSWQDITEGNQIYAAGTSKQFNTGEWANEQPEFIEEKCTHCLLCTPVCPDSCIPVKDGKREEFDYEHCKGCGICVKGCPFGAITMKGVK